MTLEEQKQIIVNDMNRINKFKDTIQEADIPSEVKEQFMLACNYLVERLNVMYHGADLLKEDKCHQKN